MFYKEISSTDAGPFLAAWKQRQAHEGWCDSPSVKKVSWLVYQWLAQGKLSQFYICCVCLSVHLSLSVQLSQFKVTWLYQCLSPRLLSGWCHPASCLLSQKATCLTVSMSVCVSGRQQAELLRHVSSLWERKRHLKLQIGIFYWGWVWKEILRSGHTRNNKLKSLPLRKYSSPKYYSQSVQNQRGRLSIHAYEREQN